MAELCRSCGIRPVERLGTKCHKCASKWMRDRYIGGGYAGPREPVVRKCNRCGDRLPLRAMMWCGECAIANAERQRGKGLMTEEKIDALIAFFKERMAEPNKKIDGELTEDSDLSEIYQAFEESEQVERKET